MNNIEQSQKSEIERRPKQKPVVSTKSATSAPLAPALTTFRERVKKRPKVSSSSLLYHHNRTFIFCIDSEKARRLTIKQK